MDIYYRPYVDDHPDPDEQNGPEELKQTAPSARQPPLRLLETCPRKKSVTHLKNVRSPHLGRGDSLRGATVQHNHAVQRHLGALGVLLEVLPQV